MIAKKGRPAGLGAEYKNGHTMVRMNKAPHELLCSIARENGITLAFLVEHVLSEFLQDETAVLRAVELGKARAISDRMRSLEKQMENLRALERQMENLQAERAELQAKSSERL